MPRLSKQSPKPTGKGNRIPMHVRRDLKNSNSADPASNLKGIRISWSAVERGGGGFIRYTTTHNTEATREHIERA